MIKKMIKRRKKTKKMKKKTKMIKTKILFLLNLISQLNKVSFFFLLNKLRHFCFGHQIKLFFLF